MQYRIIYKTVALSWVFSLFMMITLTAIADSNHSRYSSQLIDVEYNPWAIPPAPENSSGFQQALKYQNQQYQGGSINRQDQARSSQFRRYRGGARFVTPGFLESLKRQQSQHQMMPENWRDFQLAPRQLMPQQPGSSLPGSGSFGYPSYGTDYLDPLYDTPAVTPWSPWDIGSDVW